MNKNSKVEEGKFETENRRRSEKLLKKQFGLKPVDSWRKHKKALNAAKYYEELPPVTEKINLTPEPVETKPDPKVVKTIKINKKVSTVSLPVMKPANVPESPVTVLNCSPPEVVKKPIASIAPYQIVLPKQPVALTITVQPERKIEKLNTSKSKPLQGVQNKNEKEVTSMRPVISKKSISDDDGLLVEYKCMKKKNKTERKAMLSPPTPLIIPPVAVKPKVQTVEKFNSIEVLKPKVQTVDKSNPSEYTKPKVQTVERFNPPELNKIKVQNVEKLNQQEVLKPKIQTVDRFNLAEVQKSKTQSIERCTSPEVIKSKVQSVERSSDSEVVKPRVQTVERSTSPEEVKPKIQSIERSNPSDVMKSKVKTVERCTSPAVSRQNSNKMYTPIALEQDEEITPLNKLQLDHQQPDIKKRITVLKRGSEEKHVELLPNASNKHGNK